MKVKLSTLKSSEFNSPTNDPMDKIMIPFVTIWIPEAAASLSSGM